MHASWLRIEQASCHCEGLPIDRTVRRQRIQDWQECDARSPIIRRASAFEARADLSLAAGDAKRQTRSFGATKRNTRKRTSNRLKWEQIDSEEPQDQCSNSVNLWVPGVHCLPVALIAICDANLSPASTTATNLSIDIVASS